MSDDRTHLARLGLAPTRAATVAAAFVRCDDALDAMAATVAGRHSAWIPGRVELLGKHTDYAGGRPMRRRRSARGPTTSRPSRGA
ncbi:MAG: galactokinase family protein [Gemmatimonadaceae bacterium]|nr:galactokinase family protein [Gemmatimonadaceae bacterium]